MGSPEDTADPERPPLPGEEPPVLAQGPAVPPDAASAENVPASEASSAPAVTVPSVTEPPPVPVEEASSTVATYLVDAGPELDAPSGSTLDVSGQSAEDAL